MLCCLVEVKYSLVTMVVVIFMRNGNVIKIKLEPTKPVDRTGSGFVLGGIGPSNWK
jgi:hypothetical protein